MTDELTAGYGRLSRWHVDQTSTERQLADEQKLADIRNWGTIVPYVDAGKSAYDQDVVRPAYEALLADIEAGRVKRVLIWKIDRIARRLTEFMRFQQICDKHGVTVASVNDPYDTSTPIGRAVVQILAVFAELESATIELRVRSAKNMAATKGGYAGGGSRAFGYTPNRDGLVEPEASAIRDAADRILAGEGAPTIAREWNAAGLLRPNGLEWTTGLVSQLLPKPHLAGLRVHRGEVVGDAAWPAILTRDVHEALKVRQEKRSRPAPRRTYLLTGGLLACGRCGGPLTAFKTVGTRNYRCLAGPGLAGCGRLTIRADPVEAHVEAVVLSALGLPEVRRGLAHPKNGNGDEGKLLAELRAAETRLDAYAAEAHTMSPRAYAAATNALEAEIAALEKRAAKAAEESRVLLVGPDPVAEWNSRDLTWRAAMVAALFETPIVVAPGRGDPDVRVRLVPRP